MNRVTDTTEMKRSLKNRHLQMIALGGAIGTGLFYGSVSTIQLAGPAVMLSYLIGGCVIYLIMRMLGEMTVEEPVSGSFSFYAEKYWGRFPGFLSGWNYWFNYVIVSMAELSAVGIYMNYWFPELPQWIPEIVCLAVITTFNLMNVRAYGETEFWLAIIKVSAIIGMIVLGLWLIVNGPSDFPDNISNLWTHGGFFPNGAWGMLLSIVPVMFSFGGIELIGIAAGEADRPERSIPKAIQQVIWRILIFYVGTMLILMILWPWNEVGAEASPFVQIFSNVGIPAAAHLLNVVVLFAAISVYNSAIYSNSRMLYGLAQNHAAPRFLGKLSGHGVPANGIFFSSGLTLIVVILTYFAPEQVFLYMLFIATGAAVISWTVIVATHMYYRRHCTATGRRSRYPALFYPAANWFCLCFLAAVIVGMTLIPGMQMAAAVIPVWLIFLWVVYRISGQNLKSF